jgi:diadenosine tetraphosphate (Ap4A) HIT family hydrolase
MDSALPGYVMHSAKQMTNSLAALGPQALAELEALQASIQQAMETLLHPQRLYISRFGDEAGCSMHFHFIPIYPRIETLFCQDGGYRSPQAFGSLNNAVSQADGAQLTIFVWREFCERPDPPSVHGPSVDQTIHMLREALAGSVVC